MLRIPNSFDMKAHQNLSLADNLCISYNLLIVKTYIKQNKR